MTQQNGLDINNQEQNKEKLTHFNEAGEAHMVDVHAKDDTYRVAKACGTIKVNDAVYRAVSTGTAKKGRNHGSKEQFHAYSALSPYCYDKV